jgi:hypothetical protein
MVIKTRIQDIIRRENLFIFDGDRQRPPGSVAVRKNGEQNGAHNILLFLEFVEMFFEGTASVVQEENATTLVDLEPRL